MSAEATNRTIRIVIAEDHPLLAEGLQKLLEPEFESVTAIGNAHEFLQVVAASQPEIALIDIGLPFLNGIEATRRIAKISPTTKVVILTQHTEPQYVVESFRAGANGYVLKRCTVSELMTAIRRVLAGETYVTPLVAGGAIQAATGSVAPEPTLTSRQREVLQLVSEGYTAKEIGNALNLSVKTAVYHKMNIMDKVGLHTTAELTRYAMEHGIAPTEPLAKGTMARSDRRSTRKRTAAAGA